MKNIADALNVDLPVKAEISRDLTVPENRGQEHVQNDFETARDNILEIAKTGQEAMIELLQLASASQSDKHYSALSSMMKTLLDANEKLLTIQKQIRELESSKTDQPKQINNNLILTTEQLREMLTKT